MFELLKLIGWLIMFAELIVFSFLGIIKLLFPWLEK